MAALGTRELFDEDGSSGKADLDKADCPLPLGLIVAPGPGTDVGVRTAVVEAGEGSEPEADHAVVL